MKAFNWLWKRPYTSTEHREIMLKMAKLEDQFQLLLEEKVHSIDHERPTVIIQHVEKVIIEKLEHSNHFGTLEIQDLAGRLNIGMNYSGPLPKEVLDSSFSKLRENGKQAEPFQKHQPPSPKCTIHPKDNL
ncbi:hypothetical protein [Paenibacillus sp. GP183]|uniref:hypothetical protein n=1 Tax=Paenibacillus sp. GP183 TaxID=1882751 RepID=UPI000895997C|nr:hypothetical protein [Paenibacillus sp. GP183]SEB42820.1 hypothetical protein SAMN05443246_0247 [Paenibacillus sp. GP183]